MDDARANSQPRILKWLRTDVIALNGILGSLEAQSDIFEPSPSALASTLATSAGAGALLVVLEDVRLLLVSALALDSKFGGHVCGCRERGVDD